jgi:hypothetical protein
MGLKAFSMSVTWHKAKEGCESHPYNVEYAIDDFEYAYIASAWGLLQRIKEVCEVISIERIVLVNEPVWWNPISWFSWPDLLPCEEIVRTRPRAGHEMYVPVDIAERG